MMIRNTQVDTEEVVAMKSEFAKVFLLTLLLSSLAGCRGKELTSSHKGWKSLDCNACHSLPRPRHEETEAWECAKCHGANGACDAEEVTARKHRRSNDCKNCHGKQHGYSHANFCVSCHFASKGTVDCSKKSDGGAVKDSGTDAAKEAGQDAAKEVGQDAAKEAGQDAAKEAGQDAAKEVGQDAAKEASQDAVKEAGQDSTVDSATDQSSKE